MDPGVRRPMIDNGACVQWRCAGEVLLLPFRGRSNDLSQQGDTEFVFPDHGAVIRTSTKSTPCWFAIGGPINTMGPRLVAARKQSKLVNPRRRLVSNALRKTFSRADGHSGGRFESETGKRRKSKRHGLRVMKNRRGRFVLKAHP